MNKTEPLNAINKDLAETLVELVNASRDLAKQVIEMKKTQDGLFVSILEIATCFKAQGLDAEEELSRFGYKLNPPGALDMLTSAAPEDKTIQ